MTRSVRSSKISLEVLDLDFNISGKFNELLAESFWVLSDGAPPPDLAARLEMAYVEVRSMFISDNPFFLTVATGSKPQVGQLVPDVFFCPPERFQFGDYTLINSAFWDKCLHGKGFVDALAAIGDLIESPDTSGFTERNEEMGQRLKQWERDLSFHCFKIFPD